LKENKLSSLTNKGFKLYPINFFGFLYPIPVDCHPSIFFLISINEKPSPFRYVTYIRTVSPLPPYLTGEGVLLKLTKKADYGLIAIHYIASRKIEEVVNAKTIAERFDIPVEHLAKILQKMAKKGLVRSQNGPKGGYSLSKELKDITIGEVLTAIEGPIEITHCNNGSSLCQQLDHCTIRRPLLKIQESIIFFLNQTTLDKLNSAPVPIPSLSPF
jgi:Rrf2 family protein